VAGGAGASFNETEKNKREWAPHCAITPADGFGWNFQEHFSDDTCDALSQQPDDGNYLTDDEFRGGAWGCTTKYPGMGTMFVDVRQ